MFHNPTTSATIYTDEQANFLRAMDRYKREAHRPHPTVVEILEVALSVGYRLVAEPGPLPSAARPPQIETRPNYRRRPLRRVVLPPLPE